MLEHLDDPQDFTPGPELRKEVKQRGRQIRARRRLTAVLATALVSASALTAVLAFAHDPAPDEDTIVITPSPTTTPPVVVTAVAPSAAPGRTVTEAHGFIAEPATGLHDDDLVVARFPEPLAGEYFGGLCVADVLDHQDDADSWCEAIDVFSGSEGAEYHVKRFITTAAGTVDCGAAPGRCIVGARVGDDTLYAPLTFAADGAAPAPARVEFYGAEGLLHEGDRVRVVGSGFPTTDVVTVHQCLSGEPKSCDFAARTRETMVTSPGGFTLDFVVFRGIGVVGQSDGRNLRPLDRWIACEPCELVVETRMGRLAVPIEVAPTDEPLHPVLSISPDGPSPPGAEVRVEGRGFQPNPERSHLALFICPAWISAATLPSRPPPGPLESCHLASERSLEVDEHGELSIEVDLPEEDTIEGIGCTERAGGCVLTWLSVMGLDARPVPETVVPLDLSG